MNKLKQITFEKESLKAISLQIVIFVCFIMLFWFLFSIRNIKDIQSLVQVVLYSLTYAVILIFNIHYLFPKLVLNRKIVSYIIITLFTFLLGYLTQQFLYTPSFEKLFTSIYQNFATYALDFSINILTFTMFGGVGLAFKIMFLWFKSKKQISELENLNLAIELQNLKNQISPHFLFNTLNNLYILSKTNPSAAPDAILNLSDIMRYQLYENQKEFVPINNEIEYLKSMLELEKMRKDDLDINFDIELENPNALVQPMIFSPLVENAIKHGSQKLKVCIINIELRCFADIISFKISNNMEQISITSTNQKTGLNNLKRRLEIAYPDSHTLTFDTKDSVFTANLILRF